MTYIDSNRLTGEHTNQGLSVGFYFGQVFIWFTFTRQIIELAIKYWNFFIGLL